MYNEAELQNIFTLYDLKGAGHITRDQCKEGNHLDSYIYCFSFENFGKQ